MNEADIYSNFINKFILKDKRDRITFELMNSNKRNLFLQRLNHRCLEILIPEKLMFIPKKTSELNFIKENLNVEDNEPCLIISNSSDLDEKKMNFSDALASCKSYGFASIIIFINQNKFYLQTEQEYGRADKYIGI